MTTQMFVPKRTETPVKDIKTSEPQTSSIQHNYKQDGSRRYHGKPYPKPQKITHSMVPNLQKNDDFYPTVSIQSRPKVATQPSPPQNFHKVSTPKVIPGPRPPLQASDRPKQNFRNSPKFEVPPALRRGAPYFLRSSAQRKQSGRRPQTFSAGRSLIQTRIQSSQKEEKNHEVSLDISPEL